MDKIRILVTGAGGSASYNFCQSLKESHAWQFDIIGVDTNQWHLRANDLLDGYYVIPKATDKDYISTLNTIILDEEIDFLHAQPDVEVDIIAQRRHELHARTCLPTTSTVALCGDKMALQRRLAAQGVPTPLSYQLRVNRDVIAATEALQAAGREPPHWLRATRGAGSRGGLPVMKIEQAIAWVSYWHDMKSIGWGEFMMAEFLPGREYAWQSVWKDGKLITSCARERLEYLYGNLSVSGQSSSPTIARTVHNESVNKICTDAVLAIDDHATGVFCIDLKENKDGIPCVTEINAGRFFTTSYFFSRAGANMPVLYTKLGLGLDLDPTLTYNALPEGLMWIRQVDRQAVLMRDESCKNM